MVVVVVALALVRADSIPDERTIEQTIYHSFLGNPCVTLSDRTAALGCRTPNGGVSGRLQRVASAADVPRAIATASALPGGNVALLVAPEALSADLWHSVEATAGVVGVLVEEGPGRPANGFSPADPYPNRQYGLHPTSEHVWNPTGAALLMSPSVSKPRVSMGAADTAAVAARFNASAGAAELGAELTLQMMTTTDAATCLRRGWCQPTGGFSPIAAVGGPARPASFRAAPQVVAVMASLDSASLFYSRSPGAVSDMSGAVALLGAFEALTAYSVGRTSQRAAAFHWFTAEAWGYTGSKLFVKRLWDGSSDAPYTAASVVALLEAKQVGTRGVSTLVAHSENPSNEAMGALMVAGATSGTGVSVVPATGTAGIPPSSTMSWLQRAPGLPHAVLTDHDQQYTNRFYHSIFDDIRNVDATLVCNASTVLARAVASLMLFNEPPTAATLAANCTLVQRLLECLADSWHCPMMQDYFRGFNMPEYPSNTAGVHQDNSFSVPVKFVHDVAAEWSARTVPPSPCGSGDRCKAHNDSQGLCIRGTCVDVSRAWFADAFSPAIGWMDGYWHVTDTNAAVPVFTESNWNHLGVRVFPAEAPAVQLASLLVGGLLTVATALLCVLATRSFNRAWRLE